MSNPCICNIVNPAKASVDVQVIDISLPSLVLKSNPGKFAVTVWVAIPLPVASQIGRTPLLVKFDGLHEETVEVVVKVIVC